MFQRIFFSSALALHLAEPACAATKSWLAPASGGDRRWSVGSNWGSTAPVNGDSLIFNEKSDTTFQDECTNNISNLQLGSILFNGTDRAVPDLFGNAVTLSGGISENVSFWGASVGIAVTLGASQTFESLTDGHLDLTNVNVGVHTLALDTRLSSSRISMFGRISGSGRIEVRGPGSVSFDAPQTNTFSGLVQVLEGGRLSLRADNAGTGVPSIIGDLIVGNGLTAGEVSVFNDHQIDGDVILNPGADLVLAAFDTLPSLTLIDASVLIFPEKFLGLGGPLTAGGTTNSTIRGPISLGSASRNIVVSNNVELRLDGPISGVNLSLNRPGLIKGGEGTLLLLSNNTFAGNVSINAGRVIAAEPLSLGTPTSEIISIVTGATVVAPGGELLLSAVSITNELLTLATTNGGLSSTGDCTWAGTISVTTNAPFNVSNSTLTISGSIIGAGGIVKRGAGTLALTGTNANGFTGLTRHEAGLLLLNKTTGLVALPGDLQVGNAAGGANADILRVQAAEQIADTANVTLTSSGQLDLNAAETIGSISGVGQVRLDGGELTFGGNGTDESLGATIVGTFGLTKIGAGIQTFSGVNTYTGLTRVLAGTLRINGAQPQSPVNVIGATLEGTGTVGHITSNGRIDPGSGGRGLLTCSNLVFQAGGSLAIEIGGSVPGAGHDQIAVRGTVQLANSLLQPTLTSGFLPASGDTFVILNNDGADAVSGTFSGVANNAFISIGPGLRFQVRYNGGDGNDIALTFTNETVVAKSLFVSTGNGNGRLDPNECNLLGGSISNQTGQALANVNVEFMPLSGGLAISHPIITFPSLPANTLTPLPLTAVISAASNLVCGSTVRISMVLRQNGVLISSTPLDFIVGSGGAGGCTDGGGICTYCPDVVLHGSLRNGDLIQIGTVDEDGSESTCGDEGNCPGIILSGARLADVLTFQNGSRAACIKVQLANLCSDSDSSLFVSAYESAFNPGNLCSRYLADIGTAVAGGKTGLFNFRVDANATFVITVNEFKTGLTCADYRLTVTGGDCRPRLSIREIASANVRVSWPNAGAEWRPQTAASLNNWSNLTVTPTNAAGTFFFDISGGQTSRFFRLRAP